ncbi:MAG TPA: LptA/OstA family protein [Bauldia sp.]|nr:LptA/OstA family protein [Bauldia sp.]
MRRMAAFAFVLFAVAAPAAHADEAADIFQGFQAKSSDPIQVDAAALETYEQDNQRVSVFSGGVTVKRGNTTMTADTIKLYSPPGANLTSSNTPAGANAATQAAAPAANGSFDRIEADGHIVVVSGPDKVTGDDAVVDMKANTIVVTGTVVLSQGPNVISGNKLTVDLSTGRARVDQQPGKQIRGVFSPSSQ